MKTAAKVRHPMTVTIDPSEFTRLMSLPAADRHDLLELLGSTLVGRIASVEPLRRIAAAQGAPSRGREAVTKQRGDAQ
jgi:hypothetical protein